MTTFFDNRGVRRLSVLCDFIAKVAGFDYDDAHDTDSDNAMRQTMFCGINVLTSVNEFRFRRMKVQAV